MSLLKKIASLGVGETLRGIGSLAKDLRTAITGDLPPETQLKLNEIAKSLEIASMQADAQFAQAQSEVIKSESQAGGLASQWRPILMLTFGAIVANNYILYPYLSAFWEGAKILEIPPDMWGLLKLGISGYIVGRSAEKGIKTWKGKGE